MSKRSEKAVEYFLGGYNCAQSVFLVFCEDYGVSKESASAISNGFGGGMSCGVICGALSGAIAVIGLIYSAEFDSIFEAKKQTRAKSAELVKKFTEKFGSSDCRDIIVSDGVPRKKCHEYVAFAVEFIENL